MLLTVSLGGIAIGIVAMFVMTSRSYEVAQPALAGETTMVGLADPTADTLAGHNSIASPTTTDWQLTTVAALCDAEELLDTLENHGYAERELVVMENSGFAVRWR